MNDPQRDDARLTASSMDAARCAASIAASSAVGTDDDGALSLDVTCDVSSFLDRPADQLPSSREAAQLVTVMGSHE